MVSDLLLSPGLSLRCREARDRSTTTLSPPGSPVSSGIRPPTQTLLDLAASKRLHGSATLSQQIERLLTDPKSDRFIADFADQWLGLNAIDETTPDRNLNPEYNEWTKFSSLAETRLFLKHLLAIPIVPFPELANPGYTFLNSELARLYDFPDPGHSDLRLTKLPADSPYGGVFTHASVLKVTANGTNTTPVKRGVWLSDRFLGIHIPPPPSDINPIEPDTRGASTLREQLAAHRDSKTCAACHARFDPYGFALESFDVAGKFRENYRFLTAPMGNPPTARPSIPAAPPRTGSNSPTSASSAPTSPPPRRNSPSASPAISSPTPPARRPLSSTNPRSKKS